jgi:hypothetical protein
MVVPCLRVQEHSVIVYSLRCGNDHEFESWFKDSHAFDRQAASQRLVCPLCGSRNIAKAIMSPAVSGTKKGAAAATDEIRRMRQFVTGLRRYVHDHAEYVGDDFADLARKIHYGEERDRPIFGEATISDAIELCEEGIGVAPLPPDLDEVAN